MRDRVIIDHRSSLHTLLRFPLNVNEFSQILPVRLLQASGSCCPDNLLDACSLSLIASDPATNVRFKCRVFSYH